MRGGCFGALEGCFAGDFGAAARRGWAVLPRNSGVFGLGEGAARRFSARRTRAGARGEKIFKNFLKRSGKPKNWGVRGGSGGGLRAPYIGCAGRFLGLETRLLAALPKVRFVETSQVQALA